MKSNTMGFHSPLASDFQHFLCCHRALGKRYDSEESGLRLLDHYLVAQNVNSVGDVKPSCLESFLNSRPRKAKSYNTLLSTLRRCFDWLVAQQRLTSSPLQSKPRRNIEQYIPFIFTPSQVKKLVNLASQLPERRTAKHRGDIYTMIFLLMYCLGLRVSEALGLCREDVDMSRSCLYLRGTKFAKSRLVPFGQKLGKRLHSYLVRHNTLGSEDLLFSFSTEHRLQIKRQSVSRTFQKLLPQLRLQLPPGVQRVRLHCLRHSFAVGTLLRWYRQGKDPAQYLIYLSTFLGHVNPASTAVYLTVTGELLEAAAQRYSRFARPLIEEAYHE